VTGSGILRFLHLEQSEFKSIPYSMKREPQNYLCHCWIEDRVRCVAHRLAHNRSQILVGTDTGDILVFENADFKEVCDLFYRHRSDSCLQVLVSSPQDGKSIDSICAFSKGYAESQNCVVGE